MRARIASVVIVCLMALTLVPMAAASNVETPAETLDCQTIRIDPNNLKVVCTLAGAVVVNTVVAIPNGPTVTVSLPPIRTTQTVEVQGPRSTATINVPVPGPTQTVTSVVTAPGPTVTANGPTSTATVSVTETASGQPTPGPATLGPSESGSPDSAGVFIPSPTTVKGAAITGGILLALVALLLIALFSGYTLGYKESDMATVAWIKRLLDK